MTGAWRRLGRLFCPETSLAHPKLQSHSANPHPVHLSGDLYRIFFNARDANNRSSVGAVDINISTRRVLSVHPVPVFEHGPEGSFYADGVSLGNMYSVGDKVYLTFMGWKQLPGAKWRGTIGRLVWDGDMGFAPDSDTPMLSPGPADPNSLSYPCVLAMPNGGYRMWYGAMASWNAGNGEMLHPLHSAVSEDGDNWTCQGAVLPVEMGRAQAFSHPTVLPLEHGGYGMWVSFRGSGRDAYRIGHATSDDGAAWTWHHDKGGLTASMQGWDSGMVAYPSVFLHAGRRYMLYCGNGYGRDGFGLAVWSEDSSAIDLNEGELHET